MESTPFYRLHRVLCLLLFNWLLFVLEVHAAEEGSVRRSEHLSRESGSSGEKEPLTDENDSTRPVGSRTPIVHAASETGGHTVGQQRRIEPNILPSVSTGMLHGEAEHVPHRAHRRTHGYQSLADTTAPPTKHDVPWNGQPAADSPETGPIGQGQRGDSTGGPVPSQTSASVGNREAETSVVSSGDNRESNNDDEGFDYWNPVLALRHFQDEMGARSPLILLRQYYRGWPSVVAVMYLLVAALLLALGSASLETRSTALHGFGGAFILLGIICIVLGLLRARKIERRRRFP